MDLRFKCILLKLSGEIFGGPAGIGFDYDVIDRLASQLREVSQMGLKMGVVVGGGNIFRGTSSAPAGMDRVAADHMGMLATMINGLCMQDALERQDVETRLMSAIEMREFAEPYIKRRLDRHLEKGRVVIFAGGTGNPFFTTDTAAALRASEMGAEVLIKATKVDGIYDKDPALHSDAVKFDTLTYNEVLNRDLKVMDATAVAFCKDNRIPILVLDIGKDQALHTAVTRKTEGTLVH